MNFVIEWSAVLVMTFGVALTSYNIFPLNLWVSLVGTLMWIYLGWAWEKPSLIIVDLPIAALYIVGLWNVTRVHRTV